MCPQTGPITPSANAELASALDELLKKQENKQWFYDNLSGVIRIPTEVYDDIPSPSTGDSRWDGFATLHKFFEERFPLIHSTLQVTKINTYALVIHWQGTDDSLKPILLTGHQDTVPVLEDTLDQWLHPPFSGDYDGTWIWGRGSCDDSGSTASLSAIETLLKIGFKPKRSIVLAYGIDEERGGEHGAGHIGPYLLDIYGKDGFALLVDEGGHYEEHDDVIIAFPNTAEKGKLNVQIEVTTLGGHSSVPPPHTGIGYLSSVITALEDHPFPVKLNRNGTYFEKLQCDAAYDESLPAHYRSLVAKAGHDDAALAEVQEYLIAQNPNFYKAKFGTSQAIDLISGGVKVNALPEHVSAVANHRIADWSSPEDVRARYLDVLTPVAKELNLTLEYFDRTAAPSYETTVASSGHIRLSDIFDDPLAPAPITPTFGSPAWELLAGTIQSTLGGAIREDKLIKPSVVGPELAIGNTDTAKYWDLTSNIFRYSHLGSGDAYNGAHTINEAIRAEGFLEKVRFYSRLILNADETQLLEGQ
ncbi:carboxypeptidase S [Peniophora sp. CONT]|nr:carboxypeptidase S [Peniophora sp. CONT]